MAASMVCMIVGGKGNILLHGKLLHRILATSLLNSTPAQSYASKHYDPKFKRLRREKNMLVKREDPDVSNKFKKMSPDERRMEMKKMGMPTGADIKTRDFSLSSTDAVIDPYIPREGKGKTSILSIRSMDTAKERSIEKTKFYTKFRAKRKISNYEQDFSFDDIAPQLQNIYIESQKLLTDLKKNQDLLFDYVTLRAFRQMTYKLDKATVKWEFVETLEPPRVVHGAVQEVALKENYFAQLTLRVHLRQKLAVYDRFGRLMYGDPDLVKNVLEYIVFENRIISVHSKWRVHDKVVPDWDTEQTEFIYRTHREDSNMSLD